MKRPGQHSDENDYAVLKRRKAVRADEEREEEEAAAQGGGEGDAEGATDVAGGPFLAAQLSLLQHKDGWLRLRAIASFHAHLDLLRHGNGAEFLLEALCGHLGKEEDSRVLQQIVRLLVSLSVMHYKVESKESEQDWGQRFDHSQGSSSKLSPISSTTTCFDAAHTTCRVCQQSALINGTSAVVHKQVPAAGLVVKRLLSCLFAVRWSGDCSQHTTLKLQILRSVRKLMEETEAVQLESLDFPFIDLLSSSNPFIRAHMLALVATIMATDSEAVARHSKHYGVGLFEAYARDPEVFVRKTALGCLVLVSSRGFLLTEGCYAAASDLLEDFHEPVRLLAVQVLCMWMKQEPTCQSNDAFVKFCRMMTDMEMSVRTEACRALFSIRNVREELLLQALTKKPLESCVNENTLLSISAKTVSENELDILELDQDIKILDKLNMGALVHVIEDEFFEVRTLAVQALAKLCESTERARTSILEMLIDMLNDDSKDVRLSSLHGVLHFAHKWGLICKENHLLVLHRLLEDTDSDVYVLALRLLAMIKLSSLESFKTTFKNLMDSMPKHPKEEDGLMYALYSLGKVHSTYVKFLAKDLLAEVKFHLSGDTGLDEPRCGCLLALIVGASTSDASIISIVPAEVMSMSRLLGRSFLAEHPILDVERMCPQSETYRWFRASGQLTRADIKGNSALSESFDEVERIKTFAAACIRRAYNLKSTLQSKMFGAVMKVLNGCRRDLRLLLGKLEDEVFPVKFALYFVECLDFLSQGWIKLHEKKIQALPDLSFKLEFSVRCMQHAFVGHTVQQRLQLLELSMIPVLWRVASIPGAPNQRDQLKLIHTIDLIQKMSSPDFPRSSFITGIENKLVKSEVGTGSISQVASDLASSYWPDFVTISNTVTELKAELTVPGSAFEHPLPFLPGLPLGISVTVHLCQNLYRRRMWVRTCIDPARTEYKFLDIEEREICEPVSTTLQINYVPNVSKCTLKVLLMLECPEFAYGTYCRGPKGFLLPLTPEKDIHLTCKHM